MGRAWGLHAGPHTSGGVKKDSAPSLTDFKSSITSRREDVNIRIMSVLGPNAPFSGPSFFFCRAIKRLLTIGPRGVASYATPVGVVS